VNVYYYDVFGRCWNTTWDKANGYQFVGGYGVSVEREKFGLIYMRARYYDSNGGRFLTRDILYDYFRLTSLNLYLYCENNPVLYIDIFGLGKIKVEGLTFWDYFFIKYSENYLTMVTWQWRGLSLVMVVKGKIEPLSLVLGSGIVLGAFAANIIASFQYAWENYKSQHKMLEYLDMAIRINSYSEDLLLKYYPELYQDAKSLKVPVLKNTPINNGFYKK